MLTRVSYGQDGSDTNLSTPGFLSPDACHVIHRNPRITIFARHNRVDIIVHHPLHAIQMAEYKEGSHDPVLNTSLLQRNYDTNNSSSDSVGGTPSSKSQAMLTMGDDPSSRRRPVVHHLGILLHSLAI